jgi:hypothetical protein
VLNPDKRLALLETISELGATFEGATESLFAIDVEDERRYGAVCGRLFEWEKRDCSLTNV